MLLPDLTLLFYHNTLWRSKKKLVNFFFHFSLLSHEAGIFPYAGGPFYPENGGS